MIHRAKFQNFKALRDVEITFDSRLTVLVGPNGSGKTSVLQGINSICRALRSRDAALLSHNGARRYYSKNGSGELVLELGADFGHQQFANVRCRILLPQIGAGNGTEKFRAQTEVSDGLTDNPNAWRKAPPNISNPQAMRSTLLRLSPNRVAESSIPAMFPSVASDGSGTPSALVSMVLADPPRFARLLTTLQEIIPTVRSIRFQRVPVWITENETVKIDGAETTRSVKRERIADQMLYDFVNATGVVASMASDGTLLATGLLAWIYSVDGRYLLLDDLDHGLHPKAQMELVNVLRKLLVQFPDLQIIATSHSPYILNKLEWNEVRVTGLREDGSAMCVRLEDHPDVEKWRDAMTPGEFWSHAGDDWVKKLAKPAPATPEPATAAP